MDQYVRAGRLRAPSRTNNTQATNPIRRSTYVDVVQKVSDDVRTAGDAPAPASQQRSHRSNRRRTSKPPTDTCPRASSVDPGSLWPCAAAFSLATCTYVPSRLTPAWRKVVRLTLHACMDTRRTIRWGSEGCGFLRRWCGPGRESGSERSRFGRGRAEPNPRPVLVSGGGRPAGRERRTDGRPTTRACRGGGIHPCLPALRSIVYVVGC